MSDEQGTTIERVRVLHGHTDSDSAYVVDDYPYGYWDRCTIRYWIETATKGAKKGQQQMVSQTTNPKVDGQPWNKPKGSRYSGMAVLYLNGDDHVKWWGAGLHLTPVTDARMRLMGIYEQFTEDQRLQYDAFVALSRRYEPPWEEFDEAVTALAAEIGYTGANPEFEEDGWTVWTTPDGCRFSLGDPRDVAVYLAAARQRMAEDG
jgi:hypothetical protein